MPYSNIDKPSSYFNTVTYTGTGTTGGNTLAVTGVNFQPDFVWVKNRTVAVNHYLYDIVRGTGSAKALGSNTTSSESTFSSYAVNGGVASLDSNGFTAYRGTDNTYQGTNLNGNSYVAWNWLASNTSGSSNTSGTISSTVSANTTSGFSIVSYTGTGTAGTVGHGLGVAPKMIIVKVRSTTNDWIVYHSSLGNGNAVYLNLTNANASALAWNSTSPTSSVFSIGTQSIVNTSSATYIAYCFAEVKGYSKFGSYTGNGSADGTFVYTGFKPAFVICKSSSNAYSWVMHDSKRPSYNATNLYSYAQATNTEGSDIPHDFVSNGFKIRSTFSDTNGSGMTYIYMAFAENPFVSSKGLPCNAR
jgi:hypothetical protein